MGAIPQWLEMENLRSLRLLNTAWVSVLKELCVTNNVSALSYFLNWGLEIVVFEYIYIYIYSLASLQLDQGKSRLWYQLMSWKPEKNIHNAKTKLLVSSSNPWIHEEFLRIQQRKGLRKLWILLIIISGKTFIDLWGRKWANAHFFPN